MEFIGVKSSDFGYNDVLVFSNEEKFSFFDKNRNVVLYCEDKNLFPLETISSGSFDGPIPEVVVASFTNFSNNNDEFFLSNSRLYTIPKSVQEEAKRGLEWRKKFKRGGTSVGLNTARTLASGGQIGIKKVRHIAKYFPRHEVDKKGKGYKPSQDGYPSKGRIAWALWGGDAAQSWASSIVERENKKKNLSLISSSGHYDFETPIAVDLSSFSNDSNTFLVRLRLDDYSADRLYCVDFSGKVSVWDDGCWDDLGEIFHDIDTYDRSLDDPYDTVKKTHVKIDSKTAVVIASFLDKESEESSYKIKEIFPYEYSMFSKDIENSHSFDIEAIIAATPPEYTPEERAENARSQLRDALGRFAQTGSRVVVSKQPNLRGVITNQDNRSQSVTVELDDGRTIDVPANQTQKEDTFKIAQGGRDGEGNQPTGESLLYGEELDTSGILGEPRTPFNWAAQLPGTLPALNPDTLKTLLNDYPAWVQSQRLSEDTARNVPPPSPRSRSNVPDDFRTLPGGPETPGDSGAPSTSTPSRFEAPDFTFNRLKTKNAMNDPVLRAFLQDPKERGWYTQDIRNPDSLRGKTKTFNEVYDSKKDISSGQPFYEKGKGYRNNKDANYWKSLVSSGSPDEYSDPKESDVAPLYMALVAEDDPAAVMDLISLIPVGPTNPSPSVFKRKPGTWVAAPEILKDMMSPTPPPVVPLDDETLNEVLKQIDVSVTSSGFNLNSKALNDYWTTGDGSLDIRWGVDGDLERCVQKVSIFLQERARPYCVLRHFDYKKSWPTGPNVPTLESVIEHFNPIIASSGRIDSYLSFNIPILLPEEVESGDGRIFSKNSVIVRDLPLPLLWQIKTGDGHDGSVIVGKIIGMERTDKGIGNAYGVFDTGAFGSEAFRLVDGGFLVGVSADLDMFEADEKQDKPDKKEKDSSSDSEEISNTKIVVKKARIMAATLVPKPAFQECKIYVNNVNSSVEDQMIPDGIYMDNSDEIEASSLIACGSVTSSIPVNPPEEWFSNPRFDKATPLSVTDDGKVFGHIAAWKTDHIGMPPGTKPPKSKSKYSYFHTGVVRTAEGVDVSVGQLTLSGGHAPLWASASEAIRHYDDTSSAIADIHLGEDSYGIWASGSLRPSATPEQIRSLRASSPSGDWRPINGSLELVAICQVNVPGFPIARARVASGQVTALVAAGALPLMKIKSDPIKDLSQRVFALEQQNTKIQNDNLLSINSTKKEELSQKVKGIKSKIEEDSDYILHGVDDGDLSIELAVIPRKMRKKLAEEGKALPNGSFPIRNVNDLKNAVQAYGRAKVGSKALVRRHIVKRARSLDRTDLVPDNWKEASSLETLSSGNQVTTSLRERVEIAKAMIAAGGLDRNRGNAEELRRYWTIGRGGLKIRWNTPGDWKRCVRYLSKYMGVRSKGYCQLRHKEMTGVYTGSKYNVGKESLNVSPVTGFETDPIDTTTSIQTIMLEPDSVYEPSWEPEKEIIILMKTCGYSAGGAKPFYDEEDS